MMNIYAIVFATIFKLATSSIKEEFFLARLNFFFIFSHTKLKMLRVLSLSLLFFFKYILYITKFKIIEIFAPRVKIFYLHDF